MLYAELFNELLEKGKNNINKDRRQEYRRTRKQKERVRDREREREKGILNGRTAVTKLYNEATVFSNKPVFIQLCTGANRCCVSSSFVAVWPKRSTFNSTQLIKNL